MNDVTQKCCENSYDVNTQYALNQILHISMEPIELSEQLNKILNIILHLPCLAIESKGAIQLKDSKTDSLIFGAYFGLSESVLSLCSKVPFGTCICGLAAQQKQVVYKAHVDEQHSYYPEGMQDHGHYCVPILSRKKLLGVLNLYVKAGHERTDQEEDFLLAVANTLAGIIVRKQHEVDLQKANELLEQRVVERTVELSQINTALLREVEQRKIAEADALAASNKWQDTFDSIEDLISIQSTDFKLLRVNKAYADLFGATPETLIGKRCFEIVHQTQCHHGLCPHVSTIETNQAVTREIYEPLLDAYLEVTTSPLFHDNGECAGTVHIAKNVTARKRAQEKLTASEAHLASTLNSIGDAVISTDMAGIVTRINPAAEELTGLVASAILGKSIDEVLHLVSEKSKRRILRPIEQVIAMGTSITFSEQTLLIRKDGKKRYIAETGSPILDDKGQMTGVVFALRDITEERELELMKEQFLQTISHELRTPLSSIIGYQDLLISEALGPLNDAQRNMLETAIKNSDVLLELINDLLDLSRLESGKAQITLSPVKIQTVIDEITQSFLPMVMKKGLTLSVEGIEACSPEITTDERKLKHILRNLIGNAVKFTESGQIVAKVVLSDSILSLSVSDTGIGIPPDAQEYIFERFRQVDNSTSRKVDGTGLGLPIVKKITEIMGGTIRLNSELGRGSVFTVELPV